MMASSTGCADGLRARLTLSPSHLMWAICSRVSDSWRLWNGCAASNGVRGGPGEAPAISVELDRARTRPHRGYRSGFLHTLFMRAAGLSRVAVTLARLPHGAIRQP